VVSADGVESLSFLSAKTALTVDSHNALLRFLARASCSRAWVNSASSSAMRAEEAGPTAAVLEAARVGRVKKRWASTRSVSVGPGARGTVVYKTMLILEREAS